MNFLEQLVAEWYRYTGHFVRTNVRFEKRAKGGWAGEMDILAYLPERGNVSHHNGCDDYADYDIPIHGHLYLGVNGSSFSAPWRGVRIAPCLDLLAGTVTLDVALQT